jgi:CRP/FNR family cyclic AMP-dependent transcriptional regulator
MTAGRSSLALSRIALLEGLSPARLDALAQRCRWQNVPAGKSLLARSEADVVTLSPCVVAVLDPAGFLALLREEPVVALRVMRGLAARVRELSERVIDLSTVGVPQRLHAALLRLAQASGVVDNRARIDPLPTHLELANQISTAREQVTRELGILARSGVVVKDGRALVVPDVRRLQGLVVGSAPIPTIGR